MNLLELTDVAHTKKTYSTVYEIYLLNFLSDFLFLNKDHLGTSLRLDELLAFNVQSIERMDFGLLQLFVLEGVGVDGLWSDELSLLLTVFALRSKTEAIRCFWASDAFVEVDRLGVDGLLSFLDNGVSDLTVSFHGLLVNIEETAILLGFHVLLVLVQLIYWSRSVEG
ncbi:hypothetical protein GCK72_023942 [Caenorhabditis remanei]|uniref:Uncharacterized protein n=1 Tax=Caenorhabditis remanei TaxID=31234 RepID=A0A6A5FYM2_CAERE|nr:hypothetical protein GCK72_023942 [Caenorhabditis remanei]KAF1747479.1 hypothetical protein GCK72_023942 [Caenorhabditis remanei]